MKEVYGIIYKIENLVNGKIYIGQTTRSFNERYCAKGKGAERVYGYLCGCEKYGECHNVHLLRSMKKYGVNNFKVYEIFDVAKTQEELDKKEQYWIKYYNSCDPNFGYNSRLGGIEGKIGKDYYLKKLKNNTICPVLCIETGEMFISKAEAVNELNISSIKIIKQDKIIKYNHYRIKDNYEYNTDKKYTFIRLYTTNPKHIPIVCLTNKVIYFSTFAVNKQLFGNSKTSEILKCCEGELEFVQRKYKKSKFIKKYKFMYAIDYLIDSKFN